MSQLEQRIEARESEQRLLLALLGGSSTFAVIWVQQLPGLAARKYEAVRKARRGPTLSRTAYTEDSAGIALPVEGDVGGSMRQKYSTAPTFLHVPAQREDLPTPYVTTTMIIEHRLIVTEAGT